MTAAPPSFHPDREESLQMELERHVRQLQALQHVTELLSSTLDLKALFAALVRELQQTFGYSRVVAYLHEKGQLVPQAAAGYPAPLAPLSPDQGVNGQVFRTGQPIFLKDVHSNPHYLACEPSTAQEICVPLMTGQAVLGTLNVEAGPDTPLTDEDYTLLQGIARQAGVAVENALLFAQVAYAKQEWEQTFDAMADAVLIVSPECRVLRCNWAAARLAGLKPWELVGQDYYEALLGSPGPIPNCPLQESLRSERPATLEYSSPRHGDRVFHISAVPRLGKDGALFQAIVILRDVTQEHRLRQQLVQAEKLSAVGQLVAGVAHELNNPLTSVLGYAQLIEATEGLPAGVREDLQRIASEARRASRIVRHLLTFAREQKTERRLVQVNTLVQQVLDLQAHKMRAENIEVVTQLDPALPQTLADPYQLQQVLLNLITNAEQAMTEAHGQGRLTLRTSALKEGRILITVADDGPGIPPEDMGRIFDPFFTTKEVGRGTGLGLSICYGIVAEHGGRIWAQSRLGEGATFFVELPVVEETGEEVCQPIARRPGLPLRRGRILVVDDEPLIRAMLDRFLTPLGHQVEQAESAEAAQERLRQGRYDAIFCDLKMPGMGGEGLYRWLQETDPSAAHRIVFITGDLLAKETATFIKEAKAPCLEKPFRLEDVISRLRKLPPASG
ncbi:MAG: hybrid sensor histidine kinase/response regulator [Anaerolineae bacterium]